MLRSHRLISLMKADRVATRANSCPGTDAMSAECHRA